LLPGKQGFRQERQAARQKDAAMRHGATSTAGGWRCPGQLNPEKPKTPTL